MLRTTPLLFLAALVHLSLPKTALGVIVTPHAAAARNSMCPVLDSQCAQHRENRLMCVGVRQRGMRREAI